MPSPAIAETDGKTGDARGVGLMGSFYEYMNESIAEDRAIGFLKARNSEIMPTVRHRKMLIEFVDQDRINEIVHDTVSLIKTIGPKDHGRIERYVKDIFYGKKDTDDFIRYLLKYYGLTTAQAELIAYDQINKVSQLFLVEKWKKRGVSRVRWVHCGSHEPRKYHLIEWDGRSGLVDGKPNGLNGFVFELENPPVIDLKTNERGYPGRLVNCQCKLEIVD